MRSGTVEPYRRSRRSLTSTTAMVVLWSLAAAVVMSTSGAPSTNRQDEEPQYGLRAVNDPRRGFGVSVVVEAGGDDAQNAQQVQDALRDDLQPSGSVAQWLDQLHDQASQPRNGLDFVANDGSTGGEADYVALGQHYSAVLRDNAVALVAPVATGSGSDQQFGEGFGDPVIMSVVGGAKNLDGAVVSAAAVDPTPGAESREAVSFADVLPGIDVVYSSRGSDLEYSFVIEPGADPADIVLAFDGTDSVSLRPDGTLAVDATTGPDYTSTLPYSYQMIDGAPATVQSAYVTRPDGTIGFELGPYDQAYPVIIDPTFTAATTAGWRSFDGGTIDVAVPSGVASGNLLLAQIVYSVDTATGSITPPAGWTTLNVSKHFSQDLIQGVFWRLASSSEPASYGFTLGGTTPEAAAGAIGLYRNVDPGTPITGWAAQHHGPGVTNLASGSVTTSVATSTIVALFGALDDGAVTSPAGMVERWDFAIPGPGVDPPAVLAAASDELLVAAGPSGTRTATVSASDGAIVHLVAIRPNCYDSDGDGLCDDEEDANTDADNDPATNPGPDTDGDSTPNYLDADDDGDGILTSSENADPNNDGDPRDAVDSDYDGQPDWLDPPIGPVGFAIDTEQKISPLHGGLTATIDANDNLGNSISAIGDVDGDGIVDMAAGTFDDDGGTNHGAVHVLFLNADGTVKAEQKISSTSGGFTGPLSTFDVFGPLSGIGDIDGDGIPDLAVGAHYDDDGGTNRGAIYVLFLNADGTVRAEQKISDIAGGLSATLDDSGRFGVEIGGLGDLDGDGVNDIAVGVDLDDDGGTQRGSVFVLFLNADGTVKAEQKISETAGGFTTSLDDYDHFGRGVAGPGDIDGDGINDLVVGVEWDNDGGSQRGALYVLFLNADGTVKAEQKISDTTGGLSASLANNDWFGMAARPVGDLDRDGVPDLLVGAQGDSSGQTGRGAAYLLLLNRDGTVKAERVIDTFSSDFTGPLDGDEAFGSSMASLGDLDGDGRLNIAFGARHDDDGGTDTGSIWVLDFAPGSVTVNSTGNGSDNNPFDHFCSTGSTNSAGDPECTLRAAIEQVNAEPGIGTILFDLPTTEAGYAAGPPAHWVIAPTGSELPPVSEGVLIDATTQPGWAGDPVVQIDGSAFGGSEVGLWVDTDGLTVQGLSVTDWPGSGMSTEVESVTLSKNWFGVDPLGAAQSNGTYDLKLLSGAHNAVVGGSNAADGNRFAGGGTGAVALDDAEDVEIRNNSFGLGGDGVTSTSPAGTAIVQTESTGTIVDGNRFANFGLSAIEKQDSGSLVVTGNTFGLDENGGPAPLVGNALKVNADGPVQFGGTGYGEGNVVANGVTSGVAHVGGWSVLTMLGNSFYDNGSIAIDLGADGVTANDAGDVDTGPNSLLNSPVITSVTGTGLVSVDFELDVPSGGYRVEFFSSTSADPSGYGEGEALEHSHMLIHTGSGIESFSSSFTLGSGLTLTATVTEYLLGSYGATSEFSAAFSGACPDADSDGICTSYESQLGDTDGDTIANENDTDDDGDGILTSAENADPNGDGIPRDALDSDHDGQPDWLDQPTVDSPGTIGTTQKISDLEGGFVGVLDDNDQFGQAVTSLGDLDGDGIVDMAVGQRDDDGGGDRGAVQVLFMNADGTVKAEQKISSIEGGLVGPLENYDYFGIAVAGIGDLDGDGLPDLAVGAHYDDDGGSNRGAVYVLFLNADGTVKAEQKISNAEGGFLTTLDSYDRFGASIANLGDIDSDGVPDLAVGAQFDDDGGSSAGAVYVLRLNADGTVKAEQKISSLEGGLTGPLENNDMFGYSVAGPGDLDGDGVPDLVVGAEGDDDGGGTRGAVYVLFLNADGTVRAEQKISSTTGGLGDELANGDELGSAIAAVGDLDSDGVGDIIVGAGSTDDGGSNRGAFYVLFLNADGTVKTYKRISNLRNGFLGDLDNTDWLGSSAASLGDLDGDGTISVAVGAYGDDDGGSTRGAIYVLDLAPEGNAVTVNSTADSSDATPGDGVCHTGSNNSEGDPACTLRAAIEEANAGPGATDISFAIPTSDPGYSTGPTAFTFTPATAYERLVHPTVVDATTQSQYVDRPVIAIDGTSAGSTASALYFEKGTDDSAARGFALHSFDQMGIRSDDNHGLQITGNLIGLDIDGTTEKENRYAIYTDTATSVVIGGTTATERNVVSGNEWSIAIYNDSNDVVITGNYIGTDITGLLPRSNERYGVYIVNNSDDARVGGPTAAEANVIAGNDRAGVYMSPGSSAAIIQGNLIGVGADGTTSMANQEGIDLRSGVGMQVLDNTFGPGDSALSLYNSDDAIVQGNFIGTDSTGTETWSYTGPAIFVDRFVDNLMLGGTAPAEANLIRNGGTAGVQLAADATTGSSIIGNSISSNGGPGIDLGADGVTPNDAGDVDTGPNDLLNRPAISHTIETTPGTLTTTFELDVPAGNYRIEIFRASADDEADDSDAGEGKTLLSIHSIAHTGSGSENFVVTHIGTAGQTISATATADLGAGDYGSTSEFSRARFALTLSQVAVNDTGNASDTNPGDEVCDTGAFNTEGELACTMRAAAQEAAASGPLDDVVFDMPITAVGYVATPTPHWLIQPSGSAFADFRVDSVDATTQPGWTGNPVVQFDGSLFSGSEDGLLADVDNMLVRGLSITNWPSDGARTYRDGVRFESNWFGVAPTGVTAANAAYDLVITGGAANVVVGGNTAAEGNVFASAGTSAGIGLWSSVVGTDVANNRFGIGADGVTNLGPNSQAISSWPSLSTTIRDNIFGNTPEAAIVVGGTSDGTVITGNTFGLTDGGAAAPSAVALWMESTGSVRFGGTGAGEGNTVRNTTLDGLRTDPATTGVLTAVGNTFAGGSGLGIDLGFDGVTLNDIGDTDTGSNGLLNFPDLVSVSEAAGTVTVDYDLDLPAGNYRIEFFTNPSGFSPTGYGEGEVLAQAVSVSHTGAGAESFTTSFAGTATTVVTALTIEDLGGGAFGATSEFSAAVQVCADPDGDGLCTRHETLLGDTDGDTLNNENDPDDDNDGTPTAAESSDPNGDGNPRDAVDSDRDGQPDYLDQPTKLSEPRVATEQKISDTQGGFSGTLADGDSFGQAVAAIGDLDGDGIVDVVVGAPFDNDGGTDRGAIWVLFMNADGTVKAQQKISDSVGGFATTLDDVDHFGVAVAALGDLDGDGLGDVLVGARYDDDGGSSAGAAYVLLLNADGTVKAEQKISNGTGGLGNSLTANDEFGHALAGVGDINGDGINDAVVGAHGDSDGGSHRGAVFVLFLNADGTVKGEQKISDTQGGLTAALDDLDEFGDAVAVIGDLNGNGRNEIAVGAFRDDDGGSDRGAVYVLFLNADGTVASEQKLSASLPALAGLASGDYFGTTLGGIGDLNRDGVADLAVGATGDDDGGGDLGAVYLLSLESDGSIGTVDKISSLVGGFSGPLSSGDLFSGALAVAGDLDGDGRTSLLVGAFGDDDGGSDRGSLYVLDLAGPTVVQDVSARRSHLVTAGGLDPDDSVAGIVGDAVMSTGSSVGSSARLVGPATDITSGAWSLSGWINASSFGTDPRIAAKTASDGDTIYELLVDDTSASTGQAVARLKLGSTTHTVSGGSLSSGGWHYLAASWDGAALTLYVDGAQVATTPAAGTIATDLTVPLTVGNLAAADRPLTGLVDEVRLGHHSVSQERVAFEYANVTSQAAVVSVGAEQTGAAAPWTVDGTQTRSGVGAAKAPELATAGSDAWLTAVGLDEPGIEFTSWWWLSTNTGIDAAAGTRTGASPTDQYETSLTSAAGWDLATDVSGTRTQQAAPAGTPATGQWIEVTIRTDESGNSAVAIDGVETIAATAQGSSLLSGSIGLRAGLLPAGQSWYVDDARARKYLSSEPVASLGPLERN